MNQIGLLVMAYGGPNNIDEVEPYLLDVRGYRPTAPEIIHEVRERYREIGGRSPILEQTQAQAAALESALNTNRQEFKAFVGMRHWHPYIKDTLAEMQAQGIERTVGLVMAPHYSRMSIEAYFKKIAKPSLIEVAPIRLASASGIIRDMSLHLSAAYAPPGTLSCRCSFASPCDFQRAQFARANSGMERSLSRTTARHG